MCGNKMRVYREVWEGIPPEADPIDPQERAEFINQLRKKWFEDKSWIAALP